MKKNTKDLLFERMHTIGGMPLKEDKAIQADKIFMDKIKNMDSKKRQVFDPNITNLSIEDLAKIINDRKIKKYQGYNTYTKRHVHSDTITDDSLTPEQWMKQYNDKLGEYGADYYEGDDIDKVEVKEYPLSIEDLKPIRDLYDAKKFNK